MGEPNSTANQVRQVLMNELGLTRESVREMMREIVTQEVKKRIDDKPALDALVTAAVEARLKNYHPYGALAAQVSTQIRELLYPVLRDAIAGVTVSFPLLKPEKPPEAP